MMYYMVEKTKGGHITQTQFRAVVCKEDGVVPLKDAARILGLSLDAARILAVCTSLKKPSNFVAALKKAKLASSDKDWKLYPGAIKRALAIAKEQGVSLNSDKISQKPKIVRKPREKNRGGRAKKVAPPHKYEREWLLEQYSKKERSVKDIAEEMSISTVQVWYYLRKHKIPLKTTAKGKIIGKPKKSFIKIPPECLTKAWLVKNYITLKRPIDDICKDMGDCTRATFHRHLKLAGINVDRSPNSKTKGKTKGIKLKK